MKRAVALGGAVVLPNILTGCVTSAGARRPVPSERVTMGVLGYGWQGGGNTESFLKLGDVQILAVCDVDQEHLAQGKAFVDGANGNQDCAVYNDFEEMFARDDIDTILISLPDHWHAIPAIAAANAGKHVWGEKPLSHTLAEGRAMVEAVERNGVTWQTGSWQRSVGNFHHAAELVRNGAIGRVHTIECGLTSGQSDYGKTAHLKAFTEPPAGLDYARWLGPAGSPAEFPYAPARVHKNWRWVMAHGGGALMDWVGHHVDIAHWGMGLDHTGPVEVRGTGVFPPEGELWDSPTEYDCFATYADGLVIHMNSAFPGGTKWIGDEGYIFVSRGDKLESDIPGIFKEDRSGLKTPLYKSGNHWKNFIDCVRSGAETITPCETAHRSASVGHLCNIAMYTGRTIAWDPESETIANDPEAEAMLSPDYQGGWTL
ncbi:MAG: Gfo/Idh/MocA family oxidoreductase [Candidatus Hydrogenedentes bacterium]|nr:Gfo/Idh/MocA family oxidoreductase [Candidatus Hydrogenedentota bacterium]